VYPKVGAGSKFYLDIAKRFRPHRLVSRNEGEWSQPWNQVVPDKFKMPVYNPTFNKTFEEVTDERAYEIKLGIQAGKKYAVMYSGGMDSTLVAVALMRNLTQEELKSVAICASMHSIIENPNFWQDHIYGKFTIFDSNTHLYDDYINMGYTPITADEGDCIFGTSIGLQLYHNYDYFVGLQDPAVQANLQKLKYKISDGDVHYTAYKDIIIRYLSLNDTEHGLNFGRMLYEKYHLNIITSSVPVHSFHDFFWWLIFNVKYYNCSIRGAIYFNSTIPAQQCTDSMVNWFNGEGYQHWSMNNNNNGLKIRNTLATYKYVQRKYIFEYDKNEWYFWFKTKLESMANLNIKGKNRGITDLTHSIVGMTDKYEYLCIPDPKKDINNNSYKGVYHYGPEVEYFFENSLMNYKVDWMDD